MSFTLEIMKKTLVTLAIATLSLLPFSAKAGQQCGEASYYGYRDGYAWKTTANGEVMNPSLMTTAHRSLPFGTRLLVTNQRNGKSIIVKVNDRGPFIAGRVLDLSYGAFGKISAVSRGVTKICYSVV